MIRALALLAVLLVASVLSGRAAPPPDVKVDPAVASWFRSLGDGLCCGEAECRNTHVRLRQDGGIDALISKQAFGKDAPDEWREIPPGADLHRTDNPTGHAVICFAHNEIICSVLAVGL